MSSSVLHEADGPVLTITLNRPEVRNAVDMSVCEGMAEAIDRLESDSRLRVGVLTGAGEVFCSGADLRAAQEGDPLGMNKFPRGGFAGFVERERTKPVIAAAQGHALAGGLEILLACDMAVLSEKAHVGLPEVRVGIMAAAGGVIAVGRDLPLAQGMKLLLTGLPVTAAEALRLGLVTELAKPSEVLTAATNLALLVAAAAPHAVRATRQLARMARAGLSDAELTVANNELIVELLAGPDAAEGRNAFLEKRAPAWTDS